MTETLERGSIFAAKKAHEARMGKWNHCYRCHIMFQVGDVVVYEVTKVYPPRKPWYRLFLGFWEFDSEPVHLDCDKARGLETKRE